MKEEPPQLTGEQLAAVSRALGRLKAELYGRGPEDSRAFQNRNLLFCVMSGGLTTVEETLLEADDEPLVRDVRLRFQERTTPQFKQAVEEITRRAVLSHGSQILFDPTYIIEIFVLGHPAEEGVADEAGMDEDAADEEPTPEGAR